jgi:hypothetical protein
MRNFRLPEPVTIRVCSALSFNRNTQSRKFWLVVNYKETSSNQIKPYHPIKYSVRNVRSLVEYEMVFHVSYLS